MIGLVATGGADALFDEYVEAINEGTVNKNSTATTIDASETLLNLGLFDISDSRLLK